MNNFTAVAISGGIDSLMAAYILKKRGHNIFGVHFKTGYDTDCTDKVSKIADQIGINYKVFDFKKEFKSYVTDYLINTYLAGKTPNPCMVCNRSIKFGILLSHVRKLGAKYLATGHYARIKKDKFGRSHLYCGIDKKKDQSYFLARLTQEQLSAACFPLGNMRKPEVIKMAKKKGLDPVLKKESQDICFIKENTYGKFIAAQNGFKQKPGPIEDMSGNIVGEHKGLHLFTIGQRRGINCPASKPYYVVRIDTVQNRLVVGFKDDLYSSRLKVENINWINDPPDSSINVYTQIRGRHTPVLSTLVPENVHTATVFFEKPQSSVTPGQGAVFYLKDEVLGGGWIEKHSF